MDEYASAKALPAIGGGYQSDALDQLAYNRRQKRPTTREQITERILGLKAQIEKHERVLTILNANKGMEDALDALREIGV